jgi:hypothetical protein
MILTGEKLKNSGRTPSLGRFAHHKSNTDWPEIGLWAPQFVVVPFCAFVYVRACEQFNSINLA